MMRAAFSPNRLCPAESVSEDLPAECGLTMTLSVVVNTYPDRRDLSDGHTVDVAPNGREAYQTFARNVDQFDLVITDMAMPEMNG